MFFLLFSFNMWRIDRKCAKPDTTAWKGVVLSASTLLACMRNRPEVIKLFSYSTHLSTKIILLINVKMPTIVGILTFISMINTASERLKQETSLFVGILVFKTSWNFVLSWVEHEKSFITSGPVLLTENTFRMGKQMVKDFCLRELALDKFRLAVLVLFIRKIASKLCLLDAFPKRLLCVQKFSEQRFFAFISLCADWSHNDHRNLMHLYTA